jgi:1-acyl-sn-glycerol-3-phosphate acyltransferase
VGDAEIDSLCLAAALPRQVSFATKREYFVGKGPRARIVGALLRATGQIPVDRSGGASASLALDAAHGVLDGGGLWAIYPEGTRSPDGRLYRGRTGVMRVALERDCPVHPVTIRGTEWIRLWRPARVRIVIGPPMDLSRFSRTADDRAAVRAATDALMRLLERQGGLEYVDRYARERPVGG